MPKGPGGRAASASTSVASDALDGARVLRELPQPVRRQRLDQPTRVAAAAAPQRGVHVAEDGGASGHPGPAVVERQARQRQQRLRQPLAQLADRTLEIRA
jgi:hypothetical protein